MSISAKERKEIPNREMGVPSKDKYPLDSPEHIKSAAHLINHGHITSDEKKTLANKILRRAREEGVSTDGMHAVKQIAKVSEQVPPMSDGTSLGNAPPRLMAPYYDEQDELFSQLDKIDTRKFTLSPVEGMRIVSDIHKKVVADSKPPTGNQNCQLCTWCAEAQCRGMKVLPRPVYSPRDPALEIKGEMIVEHPYRNAVTSFENLMNIVSDENAAYGRFYVHVDWKGGTGGHEFLIVGLNTPFVMDAQQGYFESITNPKVLTDYFNDVDWGNSYICRLDDKPINSALLNSMNNMNKLVPWDPKLDIPYMKEHGMLSDADMAEAEKRGWLTESQTDESFIHEYVHQHHLVKVKDFPYDTLYIGLPEGYSTNGTLKRTKKKFFLTPHKRIASAYTCSMKTLEQVTGARIWDFICEDLNSSRTIPDNQMYDHLRFTVFTDDPLKTTRFENLGDIFAITDIDSIRDYLYIDTSYTSKDIFVVWGLPEIHVDYVIPCVTTVEVKALPTEKLSKQNQKLCVVQEEVAPSTDFRRVLVPSDEGTKYLKEDPECKQYWEDINKRSHGEFLIDTKNNKPIGHVFVHTYKKNKGFIYNLEVSPEYRRQGYGMILTDDAVRRFGGEDLTVDADNKPAIKMYLKYGFEIYKKGQWHYDPPKDELWMKYDRSKLTQESTNIFESGHFAKYKDDVLGFNDEGMAVMKKCKCGGKISIVLKGEPIYTCESCGKYYGTVPCNIQEAAYDNTLIPVNDYKYNKVYYGDPTNGGSIRKLGDKPLFVTPRAALATIFLGRRELFHELSRRGYPKVNLGYVEWNDYESLPPDKPLTDVHVYVRNQPDMEPFTVKYEGYLHTIDCSDLKNNIYRYKWMSEPDQEVLIANVPDVKIDDVRKLGITYHVRGIQGKEPGKPVQEGAYQDLKNGVNPYSDKMVFHVTPEKHADGQVWKPRVPDYLDPYNPEETGFEDNTTPRICFSTSIEGCLNGITVNLPRQNPDQFDKMYVYIPEKPWKEYKHKTNKELVKEKLVYDANVTREVWITEPVRMKLYGVIRVDQVSKVKRKSVVPTSKDEKSDRNYFTYKWHWVVKPKVLEKGTKYDYSQENVIADLCIDLKKFKYGLIKDGKLQTGNVSESDYEKYWVFHSGQEVDEAGGGNCWDMVEYEAGYLDAFGVPYKKYFMNFTKTDGKTPVNTHTFCVIPHNGKFIYIEQAFKRIIDEWGHERQKTFDSLKEIFQYIAEVSAEYNNQDLNYGVWDYTNAKIDYGTPANEFCNWIMSKCKMVYDGEAKKPTVKKEGYRVSRFGNLFQEADEKLSETEDITIGDLNLDDNDDIGEDGPGLPGYMEDRMSDDDLESYKSSDDDFEIPEEGDFESYKVSDEKLDAARGPIDRPQPDEEISVTDVDLGSFGKDTSDIQNEYDPKEVTILMKLMASEADAMNEYMDGAKETNVDVLRRLYADIANEERFHMEQLLYAKCELTGEKYVPKDPEVKSEYEELLKMGMDEETAMATAVDRCHIRGSIADDDTDERIEIQEDITQMESVLKMFDIIYDHTSMILESDSATPDDVDHAMTVFTEACLMQEATYNATPAETAKSPLSKANKFGPLQLLRDTLRFLVRALMTIIRKFVEFLKRIHNRSREIRRFVKQYGIKGIFSDKVRMYFVDLKQPESMYINNDVWFLLSLAVDTTNACATMLKRQPLGSFTDIPKNPKLDIRNNVARGMELLNGVQLIKSPMVVPDDVNEQQRIAAAFFGYTLDQSTNTKYYGDDGKSTNTLNTLKIICDRWVKFMQNVLSLTDSLSQLEQDKTSIFYTNKKQYDTAVKGLETVTKTCKAMISALQNDINVIIKLDNEAAEISINKTEALDSIDIKSDKRIEGRANAYEQYKRTPETSRNAPVKDRFK